MYFFVAFKSHKLANSDKTDYISDCALTKADEVIASVQKKKWASQLEEKF
jgi:hypothetical protein